MLSVRLRVIGKTPIYQERVGKKIQSKQITADSVLLHRVTI